MTRSKFKLGIIIFLLHFASTTLAQHQAPELKDIIPGGSTSLPNELTSSFTTLVSTDILYFRARTAAIGIEPFRGFNGSPANISDIYGGTTGSKPDDLYSFTSFDNRTYFFATDRPGTTRKDALWRTDGTAPTTAIIRDIFPGGVPQSKYLTAAGSHLYFSAQGSVGDVELWRSDGNPAGTTSEYLDLNATGSSFPENLTNVNDSYLVFTADDSPTPGEGDTGANREIWVLNLSTATNNKIEINPTVGCQPRSFVVLGGNVYFIANDGSDFRLFQLDPTTLAANDITPATAAIDENVALAVSETNNYVYFSATDGTGSELWKYDVGLGAASRVRNIDGTNSGNPGNMLDIDGILYFAADSSGVGRELWRSDGTAAGTVMVTPNRLGAASSNPQGLANVGGVLYYFTGTFFPGQAEIWKVLPGQTTTSAYFTTPLSNFGQITPVNNDFYFIGDNGTNGTELWFARSCGTITLDYNTSSIPPNTLCGGSGTAPPIITLNGSPPPDICAGGNCFTYSNPSPVGATLVIDPNTGEIDLENSDIGSYEVTYTYTAGGSGCVVTVTQNITIQTATTVTTNVVNTAGDGNLGYLNGTLLNSRFRFGDLVPAPDGSTLNDAVNGIALSTDGTKLYVADELNHCIRLVDLAAGTVSLYAGSPGSSGFSDNANPLSARFNRPSGIAIDDFGNLYIADKYNHRIRKIDTNTGEVSTLAGDGTQDDLDNSDGLLARFNQPSDVAVAPNGNVYVADKNNHKIRQISSSGAVTSLAGPPSGTLTGRQGYVNNLGTNARFNYPTGVEVSADGNTVYVADRLNHAIRAIEVSSQSVSTFAGAATASPGDVDGALADARFNYPVDLSRTPTGDLLVADRSNHKIKRISGGQVETFAGSVQGFFDVNPAPALNAEFNYPSGIVADLTGQCYIVDKNNRRIRATQENNPGGTVEGSVTICTNDPTNRTLTLVDYPNNDPARILGWQTSTDGGLTWSPDVAPFLSPNSETYTYSGLTETTLFRAVVQEAVCGVTFSGFATVEVNTPPAAVPVTTPVSVCGPAPVSVTLEATGGVDGEFVWYEADGVTEIVGETNGSYTFSPTANTSRFVAIRRGVCTSAPVEISVEIVVPIDPTVNNEERCGPGDVTFTATGAVAGEQYRWYAADGTTILKTSTDETDNTYTATGLTATTDFFVVIVNAGLGCESSQIAIQAIINPVPAAPTTTNLERCGPGDLTFTATGAVAGEQYRWYAADGTTVLKTSTDETDDTYTATGLTVTTDFFVTIVDATTTCESAQTAFQGIINPNPTAPTVSNEERCGPGDLTFTTSGAAAGFVYQWYAADGTTILKTSTDEADNTYTATGLAATTDFFVSIINTTTNCESTQAAFQGIINPIPTAPTSANEERCGPGVVTFTASGAVAGQQYRWYAADGTTVLKTSTDETDDTYTTVSLTATTDFFVVILDATTSCESSQTPIQGIVNTIPNAPTANNEERCGPGDVTFTASGAVAGQQYRWYAADGTTVLKTSTDETDNTYIATGLTATTDFFVVIVDATTTCETETPLAIQAIINPIPVDPTVNNEERCGSGDLTFMASGAVAGEQYRWYAADGTTVLKTSTDETDDTYTATGLTATTDFFVVIVNATTSCESNQIAFQGIVNPIPNAPTANNEERCDPGDLTFTASGALAGEQYRWYAADGTTVLKTSTDETDDTYTATGLTVTTDFFVTIVDATTTCESAQTAFQGIINPNPTAPTVSNEERCGPGDLTFTANGAAVGFVYQWYAVDGTTILKTSTDEADNTYTATGLAATTDFFVSIINTTTNCESTQAAFQGIINPIPTAPTSANEERCGSGVVTFTASGAVAGQQYRWYAADGTTVLKTSTDETDDTYTTVSLTATADFFVVILDATTSCESSQTPIQGIVNTIPNAPTANNEERCGLGDVTFTASGAVAGQQYRWYAADGTTVLKTSTDETDNTYIATGLTATTDFFVVIVDATTTCETETPLAIQAIINPNPTAPTAPSVERCGPGDVTFTATGAGAGFVYRWYAADGTTLLKTSADETDNTYTATGLTVTTDFFVEILNSTTACISPQTALQAIINPVPNAPTANNEERCDPGDLTFTASGALAGEQYRWYAADGTTVLKTSTDETDNTYTATGLGVTTDFFVTIVDATTACESAQTPFQGIINSSPTGPTANDESICGTGTVTFTASGAVAGEQYRWYAADGTTILKTSTDETDDTFTTPVLTATTDYFVTIYNPTTGCESAQTAIQAVLVPLPDPTISLVAPTTNPICAGTTGVYEANTAPAGYTYEYNWTVSGGTVISGQGTNQVTVEWSDIINGTEYLQVTITVQGTTCSATTPVPMDPGSFPVTLLPLPTPVVSGNTPVCEGVEETYTTPATAGHSYNWEVVGGTITTGAGTNSIGVTWGSAGTGTVRVTETGANGCDFTSADFSVEIQVAPPAPLANDRFRCGGPGVVNLSAEEASATDFNWYDQATGGTLLASGANYSPNVTGSPTSFWVAAVNAAGCEGPRTEVVVTIDPPNSEVELSEVVENARRCTPTGAPSFSGSIDLTLNNATNGPYSFVWTGPNAFTSTDEDLVDIEAGTYEVTITDDGGCQTIRSYEIIEDLKKITDAALSANWPIVEDTLVVAQGDPFTMTATATDIVSYTWIDPSGATIGDQSDLTIDVANTEGEYQVTMVNDLDCDTTLSVFVKVVPLELFIPNMFSPNGDNNNDLFRVYGTGIKSIEFRVFNRLGELVYQTSEWSELESMSTAWDGSYNGKPQQNGNYVWSLKGRYINDSEINETGNVLLMR